MVILTAAATVTSTMTNMCSGRMRAKRRARKSTYAPRRPETKEAAYVYDIMKPLRTKKKSTAIWPRGTSDGMDADARVCAVAEKCIATTASAATPRREVSARSSGRSRSGIITPEALMRMRAKQIREAIGPSRR